jgi:hypothetical protein
VVIIVIGDIPIYDHRTFNNVHNVSSSDVIGVKSLMVQGLVDTRLLKYLSLAAKTEEKLVSPQTEEVDSLRHRKTVKITGSSSRKLSRDLDVYLSLYTVPALLWWAG